VIGHFNSDHVRQRLLCLRRHRRPRSKCLRCNEWRDGKASDIGSLAAEESCSNAQVVNTTGDIAGVSETSDIDPLLGIHDIHAVIEAFTVQHRELIGRGQIVGFALNTVPDPLSIIEFQIGGSTKGTQNPRISLAERPYGGFEDIGRAGCGRSIRKQAGSQIRQENAVRYWKRGG